MRLTHMEYIKGFARYQDQNGLYYESLEHDGVYIHSYWNPDKWTVFIDYGWGECTGSLEECIDYVKALEVI